MSIRHRHPLDDDHHVGLDLASATVLSSAISGGLGTFVAGTTVQSLLESLVSQVTDAEVQRRNWVLGDAVKKATITPPSQEGGAWTFYPHSISTSVDADFDAAYDITYGEGYWVMSLASGVHYALDASDDGTWIGPATDSPGLLFNLKYNGTDRWVGVGAQRKVSTASTVAGPWTTQQFSPDFPTFPQNFGQWEGVEFGNGLWTIVGGIGTTQGNGGYYTSTDGQNWTGRSGIPWGRYTFAIKYAAGLWVAVGYGQDGSGNGGIATTTDPTTGSWTHRYVTNTTPIGQFLFDIDYGDGLWTAAGLQIGDGGGPLVVTSTDGINWTDRVVGDFTMLAGDVQGIAYGGGNWVLVGRADNFDTDVKIYHAADPRVDTFLAADGAAESTYNWAAHYQNGIWAVIGEDDDEAKVHLVTTADPTTLLPTADAHIVLLGTGGMSMDAAIVATISGSLTAHAITQTSSSSSFTTDATLSIGYFDAITANAFIEVVVEGAFSADASITDAVVGNFAADGVVAATISSSTNADALITNAIVGNIAADAVVEALISGSSSSDATIQRAGTGSLAGDAAIRRTQTGSATTDAFIPGHVTADAAIEAGGGSEDFQSDTFQSDTFE